MLDRTIDKAIVADSEEFAALARLIIYARQTSKTLNAEFTSYCLDLALAAVIDEMEKAGLDTSIMAPNAEAVISEFH